MHMQERKIVVVEGGELDEDALVRALAQSITHGDPVGYLKSVAQKGAKEA